MALSLYVFGYLIGTFTIIGLIIWLIIIINKEPQLTDEYNFGFNFADLEKGFAYGSIINEENAAYDRKVITLMPKDINLYNIKKNKKIVPIKFIVDKNKTITLSRGTVSADKNIKFFLPKNASDFPKEFLETSLGKILSMYVELLNADNTVQVALLEGLERQRNYIKTMGHGEVSIEKMKQLEELFESIDKFYRDAKKDKPASSPFLPPTHHSTNI